MKIGILGGSFNPIHLGHFNFAKGAIDDFGLDKLYVIPANVSPFKADETPSDEISFSPEMRLMLVRAAFNGVPKVVVDDREMTKQLAGKKVSLNASITSFRETLSGNSSPKDFETLMQMIYLRFQAPRMDAEAFESYKTRTKAQLENAKANPLSTINDTISIMM